MQWCPSVIDNEKSFWLCFKVCNISNLSNSNVHYKRSLRYILQNVVPFSRVQRFLRCRIVDKRKMYICSKRLMQNTLIV